VLEVLAGERAELGGERGAAHVAELLGVQLDRQAERTCGFEDAPGLRRREGDALAERIDGIDGALLAGYFRGANVDIGNEYLLASLAVVVIGGTSVAGGKANVPGIWGAALFLVLLLTMLNTIGVSAGVRLLLTGLVIIAVIAVAGGQRAQH